ncbi:MAG: phage tail tube protein [Rhodospirillaceae bacterium]
MPLYYRNRVLLAKTEATEKTDAVPTGAANAIQVSNLTIEPFTNNAVDRNLITASMGHQGTIPTGVHVRMTFAVEMAGSGTAGTAPAYAPLLLGCGMNETVNAGVDVVYGPHSEAGDSLTFYVNVAGTLHAAVGSRGTWSLDTNSEGLPVFSFTFTGVWVTPTAAALPIPDFSAFQATPAVGDVNSQFSAFGQSLVLQSLSTDLGNTIAYRDRVNSEGVNRTDRQSTGRLVVDAPPLATWDAFAAARAAAGGAIQFVHGTSPGNIVQLDIPNAQVSNPSYGEDQGITTLQMDLAIKPVSGDDELTITVR